MYIKRGYVLTIFLLLFSANSFPQLRIRILTDQPSDVVVFTAVNGPYQINLPVVNSITINSGESVILTRLNNRLVVKVRDEDRFTCDSLEFTTGNHDCSFLLRTKAGTSVKRIYNGSLICKSDLGTVLLINTPAIEDYIAGVVKAEGGNGGTFEYYKTQAVIARTYLYRYRGKHLADKFNLCDDVHCQVYHGITTDTMIIRAAMATRGEVIVDRDSSLIIAAFHSNCGGETAASEDVWLAEQPYLKKVTDPYCLLSGNASWEKKISLTEWADYLRKNGFNETYSESSVFNFEQSSRKVYYTAGKFNYPLLLVRNDLLLKSTFFSVVSSDDYILLKGKGYGHGVGLCQEGAMVMAKGGLDYKRIIKFYYTGVQVIDVSQVKMVIND